MKLAITLMLFTPLLFSAEQGRTHIQVYSSDSVIAQVADGGTWQTTITLMNMELEAVPFKVTFYDNDGLELRLPIVGLGDASTVQGSIPVGGSRTIETSGTASGLRQGWALLDQSYKDIGGIAVFRQSVPGQRPNEAVVPITSKYDNHLVFTFDNMNGFTTSYALVNPSTYSANMITVAFRDENGNRIALDQFSLKPGEHMAFESNNRYPETRGKKGVVEMSTTALAFSALGLRFHPGGAFTSFHGLSF